MGRRPSVFVRPVSMEGVRTWAADNNIEYELRARLTDPVMARLPGQSRLTSRQSSWALIPTVVR